MPRSALVRSAAVALVAFAAACGSSEAPDAGETELITRVTLVLTAPGGSAQLAVINDPDGNGPLPPSAQQGTLNLVRGTTYTGSILFENALVNPPENITEEVEEEADEHRVFYTVAPAPGVTLTVTDTDSQGRPLGLAFTVRADNAATTGARTLRTVLCHYVDVPKLASQTSCTDDTDIDVTFTFNVQ